MRELQLGNRALADLSGRLGQAKEQRKAAERTLTALTLQIKRAREDIVALQAEEATAKAAGSALAPEAAEAWQSRLPADRPLTLQSVASIVAAVEREFGTEMDSLRRRLHEVEQRITGAFDRFMRQWAEDSASLQPNMDSADDFMAVLRRIEVDGLPAHVARFHALLEQQSTQRLAELSSLLRVEQAQIAERLADVNAALVSVAYNPGSHIQIRPIDLHLTEVGEFRRRLSAIFASQRDVTVDPAGAEAQFLDLRALVADLKSEDPEKRRWRAKVLDVRQHVEFAAEELDSETGQQIEAHRGSAGKSGGQRQKLTATCLAAALRFKLGGSDGSASSYGAVVLDEAFTKTDDEFTRTSMRIFTSLGFQMIVATPIKSVMTLEEFIGGAVFVRIVDRRVSSVLVIAYDDAAKRLQLSADQRADEGEADA